jgi:DNA helicase II / ATP-dependent DNA helicase PcrA
VQSWTDTLQDYKSLNPEQLAAIHHVKGPLLVLAGAGSGKTQIVTLRIAHLLSLGVPASEVLAVTFTNRAAQEMRERIHRATEALVLVSTFHSLCARILRDSISVIGYNRNFVIFDEDDREKVLKECLATLNYKDEKGLLKRVRSEISQAKNQLTEPSHFLKEHQITLSIYELYQARLKEYNALDFDDLLLLTVKIFRTFPDILQRYQEQWQFILVDEYQDTNAAQYALIELLAAKHHNIFVVGDPDQSIYSWRGATIGNILNFEKDFSGAKVITLEQNYRSRNTILQAANSLIGYNQNRYQKNLWSNLGVGEKIGFYICETDRDEATFVVNRLLHHRNQTPLKECAIFYRTNFQSRLFEDALLKAKIPYVIVGGLSFYQRKEIKDLLAFLRIILEGRDAIAFQRTINIPKRGIGEATIQKLKGLAQERGIDIFSLATRSSELPIKLSQKQIHSLHEYTGLILSLREKVKSSLPIHEILSEVIESTHYLAYLREDPETYEERRSNVGELISKAMEWEETTPLASLSGFLEELSLKSSLDEAAPHAESLPLMTLHNGKGLEFSVVFLVGMEEELFPHANAKESPETIEEERRLCYVGMTRAKEYLYLTACRHRFLWGTFRTMHPSRFLKEIPPEYLKTYHEASENERGRFLRK